MGIANNENSPILTPATGHGIGKGKSKGKASGQSKAKVTASQVRCPQAIEFGEYVIQTWYSSPYPHEYVRSVNCRRQWEFDGVHLVRL